uniref:Uncharacterized protein n=1 Tax=Megaselia scalaris TaxID=36166 RepID=T1GIN3_MEGSC
MLVDCGNGNPDHGKNRKRKNTLRSPLNPDEQQILVISHLELKSPKTTFMSYAEMGEYALSSCS